MKHLIFIAVMVCVFCFGVNAQEPIPETKKPDASLKAAGDAFCAAGLKGDVAAIYGFLFHPAMRRKVAEAAGFENPQEFLDSMKKIMEQELKDNPLKTCTIDESYTIECPSYAAGHFDKFGIKVHKCGKFVMTSKALKDEEPDTATFTAALVDDKWYAVLEDPETGIDYSDTGENDMGLREFAKEFCAAMESQDPAAMEKLRIAGINPIAPSGNPGIINWNGYMRRLTESWKMNPEPVTCSVMSTQNAGACGEGTKKIYSSAGMEIVTCGVIDLNVFMDKNIWYNGLSAVFLNGAWHIDPNELIELSREVEK